MDRDAGFLWDMLEAARTIRRLTEADTYESYLGNEERRLAIERLLITLGEAARRLNDTFRMSHPEIPWPAIIAQRNVIVHQYDDVEHESVWEVIRLHVPVLIGQLVGLVPEPPSDPC